jgi:hypothetical protein
MNLLPWLQASRKRQTGNQKSSSQAGGRSDKKNKKELKKP